MEIKNYFKDNLKMLRQEKKIGQIELARKLGVSKGIIRFWENGLREPNMTSIILIANYFKVSTDFLLGLEQ